MRLEDLQAGALVRLTPGTDPVTVVSTQWSGSDVVQLVFRDSQGNLREQDVFRLAVVQVEGDTAAAPIYVSGYDFGKPGFAQTSSTYPLASLLAHGSRPK